MIILSGIEIMRKIMSSISIDIPFMVSISFASYILIFTDSPCLSDSPQSSPSHLSPRSCSR